MTICKVHSDTRCHSFLWLPVIIQLAYKCVVNVIFMVLFMSVDGAVDGADHPSKCRGHERVGLYLYSPSGLQWPVIGRENL
jgi:hypothetical protein